MSLASRDRDALDLVAGRSFADAYVVSLELEMQARRFTLVLYGPLRPGEGTTYLATLTFFGANALGLDNQSGVFPQSVGVAALSLRFDEQEDEGAAELRGRQPWALSWGFEGLAYEERPAVLASLADDL